MIRVLLFVSLFFSGAMGQDRSKSLEYEVAENATYVKIIFEHKFSKHQLENLCEELLYEESFQLLVINDNYIILKKVFNWNKHIEPILVERYARLVVSIINPKLKPLKIKTSKLDPSYLPENLEPILKQHPCGAVSFCYNIIV